MAGRRPMVIRCLVAGAVINVLIATGVLWRELNTRETFSVARMVVGDASRRWPSLVPGDWPDAPSDKTVQRGMGLRVVTVRAWTDRDGTDRREEYQARRLGCGWPMTAFMSVELRHFDPGWYQFQRQNFAVVPVPPPTPEVRSLVGRWQRGVAPPKFLAKKWNCGGKWSARIPVFPLAIGCAVNTVCYALMTYAVGAGFVSWRCARRRSRGQCVKCRYSRVGLSEGAPCPECGHHSAAFPSPPRQTGELAQV